MVVAAENMIWHLVVAPLFMEFVDGMAMDRGDGLGGLPRTGRC